MEIGLLIRREIAEIRLAVRAEDQEAARFQHALHLTHPRKLQRFWKVREDDSA